jgi:hypothetical protein
MEIVVKELIKPNVIESGYEFVNTSCPEQYVDASACGRLRCVCDVSPGNTSIEADDDIIF